MEQLKKFLIRVYPSDPKTAQIGSMDLNLFLAYLVGLPYCGLTKDVFRRKSLIIYSIIVLAIVNFAYTAFEFYYLFLHWNNIAQVIQNFCISVHHLAAISKILNTLWRLPDLRKSVNKLKLTIQTFVITEKQKEAFHNGEFENKLMFSIYTSVVTVSVFILNCLLIFFADSLAGKRFPFCVTLPNWIPNPLKIVYMAVSITFTSFQIVSTDYLNISMLNHIRYQLNILTLSFEEFDTLNLKKANRRLKEIIQHHCILIELHNEIEGIYRLPVLLQFFASLVIYALTGFWATVSKGDVNVSTILYMYSCCLTCELFFYCWFGNEVCEKSKSISASGFGSKWYKFDKNFRQNFLIFLSNTNKPFLFTAGGFMDLSLPSFAGILSKSYSYIAILQQFYGD